MASCFLRRASGGIEGGCSELNIGRIFRKYNIIEYKSPVDYLGIDDFYKVYGYLGFYKADTQEEDG